ncbi:MAG: hypothetical protein ACKOAD_02310 [Gammaproteobacteria bacterium]
MVQNLGVQTALYIGVWDDLKNLVQTRIRGLLCQEPDCQGLACQICRACIWLKNQEHPELLIFSPPESIKIDEVREMIDFLKLPPVFKAKIVLLIDAERLGIQAANALLKILEEPKPRTYFILSTAYPKLLPATVLSRCIQYKHRKIKNLEQKLKTNEAIATTLWQASQSCKTALILSENTEIQNIDWLKKALETWGVLIHLSAQNAQQSINPTINPIWQGLLECHQHQLFLIWDLLQGAYLQLLENRSISKSFLWRQFLLNLSSGFAQSII